MLEYTRDGKKCGSAAQTGKGPGRFRLVYAESFFDEGTVVGYLVVVNRRYHSLTLAKGSFGVVIDSNDDPSRT